MSVFSDVFSIPCFQHDIQNPGNSGNPLTRQPRPLVSSVCTSDPNQSITTEIPPGSSVSVVCILADTLTNPKCVLCPMLNINDCCLISDIYSGATNMTFDIDGVQMGEFSYTPTGSFVFKANGTVFSSNLMTIAQHNLTIKNGHSSGGSSLLILDSVIYRQGHGHSIG